MVLAVVLIDMGMKSKAIGNSLTVMTDDVLLEIRGDIVNANVNLLGRH